jgi:hypothetical protein
MFNRIAIGGVLILSFIWIWVSFKRGYSISNGENPLYYLCLKNSDCEIITPDCHSVSVNKNFASRVNRLIKDYNHAMHIAYDDYGTDCKDYKNAICSSFLCTIK